MCKNFFSSYKEEINKRAREVGEGLGGLKKKVNDRGSTVIVAWLGSDCISTVNLNFRTQII